MIVYLTSHIGGSDKENGTRKPAQLISENGFLDSLKSRWKDNSKVLIISSDPEDTQNNDSVLNTFEEAFPMSGLSVGQMHICDKRNEKLAHEIAAFDVLILAGGHVPTQNRFFEKIRLKEHISDFDGILIGISAGTMNTAEVVYSMPELEGEAVDKEYKRFLTGLGITKLMIIPHYQYLKGEVLDGMRVIEDIAYPDSHDREFYALDDGSYILLENKTATLFGAGYLIKDGTVRHICEKDESVCINNK